ncbi:adenosylcobinamide-phosphate synthase CbiB [uncultured Ruminococcus sp.]|uniref:adenosylcobinamide-phosphate synthase CbiB n=1 Tax=uncultured Ruminococcus sp. TaxID=165186 RepID=UPI00266CDCA4|nr:adenosylcobinamide-phosphate synthase CbiB [uncultured Ruminococcus sp.]
MWILCSVFLGFLLDLCFGDPRWLPHPVVWIGKGISRMEKFLRRHFPKTPKGERTAGILLAICIPLASFLISLGVLLLAYRISFWLWFVLHTFWAYQIPASRCLATESRKVYRKLAASDLSGARTQLSWLVGRDTQSLSEEEVTKACVETVAENTSDGVTAPLFYLLIGGVPLGFLYKAVNTLDSMVGYRNETYRYFGTASAKLDDALNWLPSRICAVLMICAAWLLRLDARNAWRIFRRDRSKHLSPNSAQTESVAAGALGIRLGGTHLYFGKPVEKPTIGDARRPARPEDILTANRLMIGTSILSALGFGAVRFLIVFGMR